MSQEAAPLVLSRSQVRAVDRRAVSEYGMSSLVLMENAGRGVADVLCGLGIAGLVVICCGRGNNAGDGFVVARHLDLRRYRVRVLVWSAPQEMAGDAAANFNVLRRSGIDMELLDATSDPSRLERALAGADWVVDALLGTGATGPPRPPLDDVIRRLDDQSAPILAVDVPSGLDCDTGEAATTTIRAAHTCTFVAAKPGLVAPAAAPFVGRLHVLDIGAPRRLIEEVIASGG